MILTVRLTCCMPACRFTTCYSGKTPLHVQLLASLDGWDNNRNGVGVLCPIHAKLQNKDKPWS
jgi:hypothetical protein